MVFIYLLSHIFIPISLYFYDTSHMSIFIKHKLYFVTCFQIYIVWRISTSSRFQSLGNKNAFLNGSSKRKPIWKEICSRKILVMINVWSVFTKGHSVFSSFIRETWNKDSANKLKIYDLIYSIRTKKLRNHNFIITRTIGERYLIFYNYSANFNHFFLFI